MIQALQDYFSTNLNHILEIPNIVLGSYYLFLKSNGVCIVAVKG